MRLKADLDKKKSLPCHSYCTSGEETALYSWSLPLLQMGDTKHSNDAFTRENNEEGQIAQKKARYAHNQSVTMHKKAIFSCSEVFSLPPSKNKNQRLNLLSMWHFLYARFPGNTGMTLIGLAIPRQLRPPNVWGVHFCFHGHGLPSCLRCAHSTSGAHSAWRGLVAAWPGEKSSGVYRFLQTHL